MVKNCLARLVIVIFLVSLCLPVFPAWAYVEAVSYAQQIPAVDPLWSPPDGFEALLSEPAVTLYRKNYPNGTPDYIQVVLLNQGGVVSLLHGPLAQERPGRGAFGGDDARFNLESLKGFWLQAERKAEAAFCVSNGSFFYMPETPTRLPFSLKVDGVILTDGYAEDQYPEQKLMLELWADKADIRPLTGTDLYRSSAPNIIAGLTSEANKRAKYAVGRTFVGIQDRDSDGAYEVLYILNTETHTQSGAAQVLQEFGAQKVMMLDGGGSTQLLCQGNEYIATGRLIPQAIAVFSADPHGLAAALVDAPVRITSGPQEIIKQEWILKNTGELTWTPGEYRLILEAGPYWKEQHFSPTQVVQPGQKLQFAWELPPMGQTGTYPLVLRWYISGAGRCSEVQEHQQELVVSSENSTSQSSGFTNGFEGESTYSGEAFDLSSAEESIAARDKNANLKDLLIVPAIVLPLGLILFWYFRWRRN